jgi:hypothetical protein
VHGDLHAQVAAGAGVSGAGESAVKPGQRDRACPARQPDTLADLGDGADAGELVLMPGHQQDAVVVAGVDGKRDVHMGEDDSVLEWDQAERAHDTISIAAYIA